MLARPYFSSTIFDPSLCSNTRKASRAILRASSCVASDGIALVMLVMLGSIVGQHKTGQCLSASKEGLLQLANSTQHEERHRSSFRRYMHKVNHKVCHQVVSKSINQPINTFNVLRGIWDPTDKKFSLLPTKHSLRKPPYAFGSHKDIKSAIVAQCCRRSQIGFCDLTWLYAGQ